MNLWEDVSEKYELSKFFAIQNIIFCLLREIFNIEIFTSKILFNIIKIIMNKLKNKYIFLYKYQNNWTAHYKYEQ